MSQQGNKFKFSFVMPIYNVEEYLSETVESILSQTMNFEKDCQIVFINDGSPDNSKDICLQFKKRYPNNIEYIEQENAGVSAARNRGIEVATGKYISFLDPDDKLSSDTLNEVYDFFETNGDKIDIVSIRLKFFDAKQGEHMLNYKYDTSRVIDIEKEPQSVQLSGGSIFVRREAFVSHDFRFDPKVKYGEDAKLINEIILEKGAYGVVAGPIYWYRKRKNDSSALSHTVRDRKWYIDMLNDVHGHLFRLSRQKIGRVSRYIQYVAMYDLQWKFKQAQRGVLSESDTDVFKQLLVELLTDIDDDIVMMQRDISIDYKLLILSHKYGESVVDHAERRGQKYYYNETLLYDYDQQSPLFAIEFMGAKNKDITIEGFVRTVIFPGVTCAIDVDGVELSAPLEERKTFQVFFFDTLVTRDKAYKVQTSMESNPTITPFLKVGKKRYPMSLVTHRYSYINNESDGAYRVMANKIVRRRRTRLEVVSSTPVRRTLHELYYLLALSKRLRLNLVRNALAELKKGDISKLKEAITILLGSLLTNAKSISWRIIYHFCKPWVKGKIWLVSDRIVAAGDNGEALFRHLQTSTDIPGDVRVYFAVARSSSDYERMKRYGSVVDRGSFRYKILFLMSDKIISSHADDFVINAFDRLWRDLIDLYKFDFVFLQHGITKDDISSWLKRSSKNMKLFVTAAKPELESIIQNNYDYNRDIVKLTGFPRYDLLENKPANKIILAPTWRQNIAGETNAKTGVRSKDNNFKNTEYYKFYQSIMSDKRIISALKKHNMTGELFLHPALSSQVDDFVQNEQFRVKAPPYDYRAAFKEGNLLITDYSSVFFDFAYLKKPVIYTQFDFETLYSDHFYNKGYFEYPRDGFGPVAYDINTAVAAIVKSIESNCAMEEKYKKRVESFFGHFDKNNSQRVLESILAIEKE
ncbi:MAG: CDP-glycerol glycerophosphotransferase family protein [Candidatus Saccharibacteria bacterium]|nr:MAG: CDP-glycerol glycerophosphotransferase family protein [Candidatus Saccharibacteria bacterium]